MSSESKPASGPAPVEADLGPDGPWAAIGVALNGASNGRVLPSLRVEGAYPFRLRPLPGLALVVSVLLSYEHRNIPGVVEYSSVNLTPMAGPQYELVLPFYVPGRLAAFFELGIGPAISFLRFPGATGDEPRGEVHAIGALRIAAGGRWVLPLGLVIALTPLGVIFTTQGGLFYEASLTLGYRFR